MSNIVTQTPVKHPGIWRGEELFQRHDWKVELTQDDLGELDSALKSTSHLRLNEIDRDNFQIPKLGSKLLKIQDSLENGSGCTRILGFPVEDYDETQAAPSLLGYIQTHWFASFPERGRGTNLLRT